MGLGRRDCCMSLFKGLFFICPLICYLLIHFFNKTLILFLIFFFFFFFFSFSSFSLSFSSPTTFSYNFLFHSNFYPQFHFYPPKQMRVIFINSPISPQFLRGKNEGADNFFCFTFNVLCFMGFVKALKVLFHLKDTHFWCHVSIEKPEDTHF